MFIFILNLPMHHIFCQNSSKAEDRLQKIYKSFENNPQNFLKLLDEELSQCSNCLKVYLQLNFDKNIEKQRILYKFNPKKLYDWNMLFDDDIRAEYRTHRNFPEAYQGFKAVIFLMREKVKNKEIWNKVTVESQEITKREISFFKNENLERNSSYYRALEIIAKTSSQNIDESFVKIIFDAFNYQSDDLNDKEEAIMCSFECFKEYCKYIKPRKQDLKVYYDHFLENEELSVIIENVQLFKDFYHSEDILNRICKFNPCIIHFLIDHLDEADFDKFYDQGTLRNLVAFINNFDFDSICVGNKVSFAPKISKLFLKIVKLVLKYKNIMNFDFLESIKILNVRRYNELAYPLLYLKIILLLDLNLSQFSPRNPKIHILLSVIQSKISEEKYSSPENISEIIEDLRGLKPYVDNFIGLGNQFSKYIRIDSNSSIKFLDLFGKTKEILENIARNIIIMENSIELFLKIIPSSSESLVLLLKERAIREFKSKETVKIIESYIKNKQILTKDTSIKMAKKRVQVLIKKPELCSPTKNSDFISIKKKDLNNSNFKENSEYEGSYFSASRSTADLNKLQHLKEVIARNKIKNPAKEAIIIDQSKPTVKVEDKQIEEPSDYQQPSKIPRCDTSDEKLIQDKYLNPTNQEFSELCDENNESFKDNSNENEILISDTSNEESSDSLDSKKTNITSLTSMILQKSNNIFANSFSEKPLVSCDSGINSFFEESLNPFYEIPYSVVPEIPNNFNSYQEYFDCFNPLRSVENFVAIRTNLFEHSEFYNCITHKFDKCLWIEAFNFKYEIHDLLYFSTSKKQFKEPVFDDLQADILNGAFLGIVTSITPGFLTNNKKNCSLVEIRVSSTIKNIPKNITLYYRFIYNTVSNFREFIALRSIKKSKILKYLLRPSFIHDFYQRKLIWDDRDLCYFPTEESRSLVTNETKPSEDFDFLKNLLVKFHKLNHSQAEAVTKSYFCKDKFFLIQGPPGTGKTTTILSIISTFLFTTINSRMAVDQGKLNTIKPSFKVLVCAPSNTAIDVFVARLAQGIMNFQGSYTPINFIRVGVGASASVNKFTLEYLINSNSTSSRSKTKQDLLRNASIVCTTLSSSGSEALTVEKFNLLIIDEACQATEISSIIPLKFSPDKVILVGDPKQLPPTILSENSQLQKSLFDRLLTYHSAALLEEQYRMHPEICELSSLFFYENQVKTNLKITLQRQSVVGNSLKYQFKPLNFIDICNGFEKQDQFKSFFNEKEEKVCIDICKHLHFKYGKNLKICILTPYKAQANRLNNINHKLAEWNIEANTIDSFQGKECDFVILSTVRQKGLGFTCDFRRINVAITRSKLGIVILGNRNCLSKSPVWEGIINHIARKNALYSTGQMPNLNKIL